MYTCTYHIYIVFAELMFTGRVQNQSRNFQDYGQIVLFLPNLDLCSISQYVHIFYICLCTRSAIINNLCNTK